MDKLKLLFASFKESFNVLEFSDKVALLALLIAILGFIWQIISSHKNSRNTSKANKKSLEASRQANVTSEKIYKLENENREMNYKKGMYILSFFCHRYFIAYINLLENKVPNVLSIKDDKVAHMQYLKELIYIEEDFIELTDNPSYMKLLESKPLLSKLRQMISFDVVVLQHRKDNNLSFEINYATYFFFQDLFYFLKEEYSDSKLWKSNLFDEIEQGFKLIKVDRPPQVVNFLI